MTIEQLDLLALDPGPVTVAHLADSPVTRVRARTCECARTGARGDGFTNQGTHGRPWWVHTGCRLPTVGWLAAQEGQVPRG